MALRRDAVAGNKVVREKRMFFFGPWVHDYSYQNDMEYHKWKMNEAIDSFAKHEAALREVEARLKALIKEIGNNSGKLKNVGPTYHIPGMLAQPKDRFKVTKPLVVKQNDDWKNFARVLYGYGTALHGPSSGGQLKHVTIDVPKPADVMLDGEPLDVFILPKANQGNNNNRKGHGGGNNNHQGNHSNI